MYHPNKEKVLRNNLSQADKPAIAPFAKRDDLILTKVYKEIAKILLEVENYINKAKKLMKNNPFY